MPIRLTQEGFDKLEKELKYLKVTKRKEVIQALSDARAHGDLSENAEYDAAKEAQASLEKRIAELTVQLGDAVVIDESAMDKDKVLVGATVTLEDQKNKQQMKYQLVSKEEADFSAGKISLDSPVGKALVGKKVGDLAEITIPAGKLLYKVIKIER